MFRPMIYILEEKKQMKIEDNIDIFDLPYQELFDVINSREYLHDVPNVSLNFYTTFLG